MWPPNRGGSFRFGEACSENSRFGVRGHPNRWEAEGSKAKKTALGSEVMFYVNVNVKVNESSGEWVGGRKWKKTFHQPRGLSHKRNLWNGEAVHKDTLW